MKINLGLICGGKSTEHEVSLLSARSIMQAVNKEKYNLFVITIDKNGDWYLPEKDNFLEEAEDAGKVKLKIIKENQIALIPYGDSNRIIKIKEGIILNKLDIAFPIIHGTTGEDGGLQGLFNILNLPFVGCDILGSAVSMDKEVTKILLEKAGIPVAKYLIFRDFEKESINYNQIIEFLRLPVFIKPAALGSSVGIKKAKTKDELVEYINFAFRFDKKVVVEEFIDGREIECSVLGNDKIIASVPGEVIPNHDFYTYEAKYIDKEGAKLEMPAKLTKEQIKKIQEMAIHSFRVLNGQGMARVDFFLAKDDRLILNEINTLPGFTGISMYPKLFDLSGIKYSELIDKLIDLGFEHFKKKIELISNLKKI